MIDYICKPYRFTIGFAAYYLMLIYSVASLLLIYSLIKSCITTYDVVWYYVFPIYSILSGLICLRGKYDGWKPEDSVDKDVRINSAIVFIAMMIGFIIFYYWGELARENGIRNFSGMQI